MVVAVLAVVSGLAVVAVVWLTAAAGAQAASSGVPAGDVYRSMTQVVVQPGQSLWAIASQVQPSADPGAVVQQIIDANGLRSQSVQPGERLWVPKG
jgi:LysM repeat protein